MPNAISATSFIDTLGVNTHLDFGGTYADLPQVEQDLEYLGLPNVRDSAETATDAQTWLAVAQATGVKFDDYIAETSQAGMQTDMSYMTQLANEGILNYLEGGDEEDDSYPQSLGNTLPATAQVQRQLYSLGQQLGLPVINMSFGSGWTAANNWQGDYGAVGNLAAYANYANAHTYPNPGQLPNAGIQQINGLANLAANGQPIITTEIGWNTSNTDQTTIAMYTLDATMDGILDGDKAMYFYALYDDNSGNWGLFNANGTARPAATALHNLTTLLADTGTNAASFAAGSLNYSLGGTQSGDQSLLIAKSNGSFWLSLWNEGEAPNSPHSITVNLGTQATTVVEYDPLTGTNAIATWSNVSSVQLAVPDHPVLLAIEPAAGNGSTGGGTGASGTASGSGTSTGNGSSGNGGGSATTPTGAIIAVPGDPSVAPGATLAITGVAITDAFAASNPGTLVLNLSAGSGDIAMTGANGSLLSGSGTHAMSVSGTLAQINTDLATLHYTAGSAAGSDSILVDIWDQAGIETDKPISITIASSAPTPVTPTGPTITAPSGENLTAGSTAPVANVSIADAFAASNPGTLALNVDAGTGDVAMTGANGARLTGSGTHAMSVNGTLAQINADLASLTYTAGAAGTDSISVNVWDQAGLQNTKTIDVSVAARPTLTIAAGNANPVELVSNSVITAAAGNHMIFIGGTGDTVTATGGTETVQAFQGHNAITTGAGNDTISYAGTANTINAGGGTNTLQDSGSSNTIVMPGAGNGFDNIFGYVLQNDDTLDFRTALAASQWNGTSSTLGNFLHLGTSGNNAMIAVSNTSNGATSQVAELQASGPVTLSTLLAHSLT